MKGGLCFECTQIFHYKKSAFSFSLMMKRNRMVLAERWTCNSWWAGGHSSAMVDLRRTRPGTLSQVQMESLNCACVATKNHQSIGNTAFAGAISRCSASLLQKANDLIVDSCPLRTAVNMWRGKKWLNRVICSELTLF